MYNLFDFSIEQESQPGFITVKDDGSSVLISPSESNQAGAFVVQLKACFKGNSNLCARGKPATIKVISSYNKLTVIDFPEKSRYTQFPTEDEIKSLPQSNFTLSEIRLKLNGHTISGMQLAFENGVESPLFEA